MTLKSLNCRYLSLGIFFLIFPSCLCGGYHFKGKDYSASPTVGISVCQGKKTDCFELKKDSPDEGWSHKLNEKLWGFKCFKDLGRFDNMNICGGVLSGSIGTCTEDYDNEWMNCDEKCRKLHPKLAGDCTKGREEGKERCVCFHAEIGFCTALDVADGDVCRRRGDAFSGKHRDMMNNLECRDDLLRFPNVTVCAAEPLYHRGVNCVSNATKPFGNWKDCDATCRDIDPTLGGDCNSSGECVCISAEKILRFNI